MADHVFETVASQSVYTGKIFSLRADEVRMPGGNVARREVVEHYGAVAIVALDDADNVTLVFQYRHPLGRRLWELPAGLLDLGGEPPQVSAARELHEEVGLQAQHWQVLVDADSAPGFSDESVRIFLATGLTDVGRPEAHNEEADMTTRSVALRDAVQMIFAGDIVNCHTVAGILAAYAVRSGIADPRPVEAPWIDKPYRFAARKSAR